jgi:hypothetical protein
MTTTAPEGFCSLVAFSIIPDSDDYPAETRGARVMVVADVYDGPADEGEALVRDAHGPGVYTRLAAVKRQYDPMHFFRLNQNISPA